MKSNETKETKKSVEITETMKLKGIKTQSKLDSFAGKTNTKGGGGGF